MVIFLSAQCVQIAATPVTDKIIVRRNIGKSMDHIYTARKQCITCSISVIEEINLKLNHMEIRILALINLIAYGFVTSQAMFYLLALARTQKRMTAPSYVELRHLLDSNMQVNGRLMYYITILTSIILVIFTSPGTHSLIFITSAIALAALVADLVFMFAGDIPVNKTINTWSTQNFPSDWKKYRLKWFKYYHARQVANFIGFLSLLVGVTCGL